MAIFVLIGFISTIFFVIVPWIVHIEMALSKGEKFIYGWAYYTHFRREFSKYQWEKGFLDSLQANESLCSIHADIFRFDNKGMIMKDPISLVMCKIHIRRYKKKLGVTKRNIVKWGNQ